ncbi:MAG: aldolase/citrate lyase family protein, partial [Burkholderiales bacterium]
MSAIDTRLPQLLRGERPLAGMFIGFPSAAIVEMCGYAGFDFIIIDNEHGPASIETAENLIRAARCGGTIPIVRAELPQASRVLDAGASGVMVPAVNSAEEARAIVAACKYPPLGERSAAFTTRAGGYTFFGGAAQIQRVNDGVAVILMIETREAYRNLDAILAVKGIDGLFIGLSDLAISMGYPGDNMHPEVQEAVANIIGRANSAGLGAGLLASTPADFNRYAKIGARFLPMTMASTIAGALR